MASDKQEMLRHAELFAGLSPASLEKLTRIAYSRRYLKRNVVFFEGDTVDGFYIVASGQAKIYKTSPEGREHIIRVVEPGMVVGEAVVLEGDHYPVTLEIMEDGELLFVPREEFIELVRSDPDTAMELLTVLTRRLRFLVKMVEDLSLKEVSARIAKYLLDQCVTQHGAVTAGQQVRLLIAKQELAATLGTIPETLSRTLKKMETKGVVASERQAVRIADAAALQRLAAGEKL